MKHKRIQWIVIAVFLCFVTQQFWVGFTLFNNDVELQGSDAGVGVPVSPSCALLFFGALRAPQLAIPSIEEYILDPNPGCDVFVHTYNITTISSSRSNEANETIDPGQAYRIADRHRVVMDTMEDFHNARNVSYYRQFAPPASTGWHYPSSMDNMIKQWHSIQRVWDAMEEAHRRTPSRKYTIIGFFRLDQLFTNPVCIRRGNAVIPNFMNWIDKSRTIFMNDRLFYGTYENAKVWSRRFDFVEEYFDFNFHGSDSARDDPRGSRKNKALHSETYLAWLMRNITTERRHICMHRLRATGRVEVKDCMTQDQMHEHSLEFFVNRYERSKRNMTNHKEMLEKVDLYLKWESKRNAELTQRNITFEEALEGTK